MSHTSKPTEIKVMLTPQSTVMMKIVMNRRYGPFFTAASIDDDVLWVTLVQGNDGAELWVYAVLHTGPYPSSKESWGLISDIPTCWISALVESALDHG